MFRGLFLAGTTELHDLLARSEWERNAGLWLTTEAEAGSITDPLASIAGRRTGGSMVEPDMGDLINAGLALAGYLVRNVSKAARIRIATRRAAQHGVHPNPADSGEQENDA